MKSTDLASSRVPAVTRTLPRGDADRVTRRRDKQKGSGFRFSRRACASLTSIVVTAAAVFALAAAAPAASDRTGGGQERRPRVNLGVLRTDGVLLPFATFDGRNWNSRWPADLTGRDLPANLAAIPDDWWGDGPHTGWRLWTGEQGGAKPIAPIAPVTVFVGTLRRLGLRTDVPPGVLPPTPFELPFPKAGLAFSGDVRIESILTVSRYSATAAALLRSIAKDVEKAEERTVGGLRRQAGWRHPFDRDARARIAPQMEAWYTTSIDDSATVVSYIEAVKKYPPQPEDRGCGLETFITGWVFRAGKSEAAPKTELRASVMYCDRDKASYMLPFGRMTLEGRTYWAFQLSGHDHEWYSVAELRPDRVRYAAEYHAGGAPGR